MPQLARLAREVAESGKARLLTENGETVAILSPAPKPAAPRGRRTRRKRKNSKLCKTQYCR
jgi:antitoxin (DNA-binding transcriptional repressor) of toxin-antitoxin stability system